MRALLARLTSPGGGRGVGVALILVSAAAFGAMPILARIAYDTGAEPMSVLALRFGVGAVVMTAVMSLMGRRWPDRRTTATLWAMGGIGYALQSSAYFTALTMIPAGTVALLLYLYPAIVTLLAVWLLGERLTHVKVAAVVVALGGTALIVGPETGGSPLGLALGASAAFCYSGYIVVGSKVMPRAGALAASTVVMWGATATFAVVCLLVRPGLPTGVVGWSAALGAGVVGSLLAIVLFFAGMARLGPADASTLSTFEPVVTVGLAALLLAEALTWVQLAGGVLVLAAVIALARARQPAARVPDPVPEAHPHDEPHTP